MKPGNPTLERMEAHNNALQIASSNKDRERWITESDGNEMEDMTFHPLSAVSRDVASIIGWDPTAVRQWLPIMILGG
jgi:hypothetical protein